MLDTCNVLRAASNVLGATCSVRRARCEVLSATCLVRRATQQLWLHLAIRVYAAPGFEGWISWFWAETEVERILRRACHGREGRM
jgi:hypothetical protein